MRCDGTRLATSRKPETPFIPFSIAEQRKMDGVPAKRDGEDCLSSVLARSAGKGEFRSQAVQLGVAVAGPSQGGNAPP